jgi:hypothetical protein
MALLGNFKDGYTKTGGNWFSRMSGYMSYVPIPFVNTGLVLFFGKIGTVIDAGGWLLRGKVGSAATALATGTVSTAVNAAVSFGGALSPVYWANIGSAATTDRTVGSHARAMTEKTVKVLGGAVGFNPQSLRSYTAGIGSIGGGMAQPGPGRFVTQVAQSRGEDPNAAYARLNSNQSDHLSALQAAQSQGGYRGM